MTRESDIEQYLMDKVARAGGEMRKLRYIGRRSATDRLVLFDGWHAMVELKAPGEKPDDAQAREHVRLARAGIDVWVIDSFDGVDRLCSTKRP